MISQDIPAMQVPVNEILPRLICGTATFNNQYNTDAFALPIYGIISQAFALGISAFDTSPYYGPSEELLGQALQLTKRPRNSYHLLTKVGRIDVNKFNYSVEWISKSIARSLQHLQTDYLDVVYCHDVEFVTPSEVLTAVKELRRIRDTDRTVHYVGISGYPVHILCELAELVLEKTGEPLDIVQSYANLTLQNTTLLSTGLERLKRAGVNCTTNASLLGMGLLRGVGVPVGGQGDFHPAPIKLRNRVQDAAEFIENKGDKLELVSIHWGLETWARKGGVNGRLGVSVIGVSTLSELEETIRIWETVLDNLSLSGRKVDINKKCMSLERSKDVEERAKAVWEILGEWKDFSWLNHKPNNHDSSIVL